MQDDQMLLRLSAPGEVAVCQAGGCAQYHTTRTIAIQPLAFPPSLDK
jgi:hypothetical protein